MMAPHKLQGKVDDPVLLTLQSIEAHLRLMLRVQLASIYQSLVIDPGLEKLYRTTGTRSVVVLAKENGMSSGKISMLWQKWEQAGLLVKKGLQYEQTV